jgi:hypothetical protein
MHGSFFVGTFAATKQPQKKSAAVDKNMNL